MALRSGVYRISKWGGLRDRPEYLTIIDGNVSIAARSVPDFEDQEWRVEVQENGNVAIQNPAPLFPSNSLSSEKPPEKGNRVVLGPVSDFPTCEWRLEPVPHKPPPVPYFIRVPHKELVVVVSPIHVYPPQLNLEPKGVILANAWVFEHVPSD